MNIFISLLYKHYMQCGIFLSYNKAGLRYAELKP